MVRVLLFAFAGPAEHATDEYEHAICYLLLLICDMNRHRFRGGVERGHPITC